MHTVEDCRKIVRLDEQIRDGNELLRRLRKHHGSIYLTQSNYGGYNDIYGHFDVETLVAAVEASVAKYEAEIKVLQH